MYKQATRLKLRIPTSKGMLSPEQLWDLSLTDLSTAIKAARKAIKPTDEADDLSFLEEGSTATDPTAQLTFDILKDVYVTKKQENKEKLEAQERKAQNQKIMSIISLKEEKALENLSVEELKKMLTA